MSGAAVDATAEPPVNPFTQPLLPSDTKFRDLMRAAENQALLEQRQRAASLDHMACSELAQAEANLLVDMESVVHQVTEAKLNQNERTLTNPQAREMLRIPLDALAAEVRGQLAAYFDDEAAAIKRAIAGLAADLNAVHEREGRRARDAVQHVKAQFETRLEASRKSYESQLGQMRDELRRDCEARVHAAKMAQQEAEAIAASATYKHPTIDAEEWRNEMAHLRVKAESLAKQLLEHKQVHTHTRVYSAGTLSTQRNAKPSHSNQCKHAHSALSHLSFLVCLCAGVERHHREVTRLASERRAARRHSKAPAA